MVGIGGGVGSVLLGWWRGVWGCPVGRVRRGVGLGGAVVVAAALLSGCGKYESWQHPFPEALGETATPADGTGRPTAAATRPGTGRPTSVPSRTPAPSAEPFAELSAAELVAKARVSAASVRAVAVFAHVTSRRTTVSMNIRIDRKTGAFDGTVKVDSASVDVRRIDDDAWLKGDRDYWVKTGATAAQADQLDGKFVHLTASSPGWDGLVKMVGLADVESLLSGFKATERGPAQIAAGRMSIPVRGADAGDSSTLYLSVSEDLRPTRVDSDRDNWVEFRSYMNGVSVVRPEAKDVIEVPQAPGGSVQIPSL